MAYGLLAKIGVINTTHSTANPCNIQTVDNIVMLCDDLDISNYTANDVLLELSAHSMRPDTEITIPVCVTEGSTTRIAPLTINIAGELSLPFSYTSATVHLNGVCWHVNSRFYTPAKGNIYNNGTSPLNAM